ncbi:cellulose biosynthesis protein BcsN [Methylobacterium nigriterrae]|uniref:cellulose biosynthesis protein BcsN n=1 Tax=Methylobacterium nigriterrae TaxID=3127512 RepID=UPI0030138F78
MIPAFRARFAIPCLLGTAVLGAAAAARAQTVPVVRLPGAGTVTSVAETRVRDGFDQRIRFAGGDGRNGAEVGLRNETGDLLLAFPPRLAKPNQLGIEGELAARFPGQVMRVVASPRRNAYGPIGLALGADCLYAWQWFERSSAGGSRGDGRPGLFGPLSVPMAGRRALSLRIRLCRTESASLADLVQAVERMVIALPTGSAIAAREETRLPPTTLPERPRLRLPPAPRQAAPPVRRSVERPRPPVERAVPPPAAPPPAAPAPGTTDAGRRYIVPPAPETGQQAAPPSPTVPPAGPQRFITDGLKPPEPQPGTNLTPSPAPGRGTGESLSPDLPSEAYRPPKRNGP